MGVYDFLVIIIIVGFIFQADQALSMSSQKNLTCNPNDMRALQDFMSGMKMLMIDGWSTNLSSNCCVLDLSSDAFSGYVPADIQLPSLKIFGLSQNSFNGYLPATICDNSSTQQVLNLANNYFSGKLPPQLGNCSSLKQLSPRMNDLTGGISEAIFQLQKLISLDIQDNKFSGPLSKAIGKLINLVHLDISSNGFTGIIPYNLNCSTLATLSTLDLASNSFTGPIPNNFPTFLLMNFHNEELPADPTLHFQKLKVLIIAIGDLQEPSPDFPLFLKRNVNIKGLQYNHFQRFPPTLDLSYNNLSGPIWPEFGNLRKLHILVLKFNKISGPIPSSFSDNQLYGEIPPRGQFSTFLYSSFEGNNLCGDP
ncbi:hypothetical protein FEM48_Zijuj09G0180200 [Ziziphus jujuba var. spinosa]|uniref:Uncharacterized protein n=1 Tax=Ziziphus jujuba var. spinosa TaxID=714518 RepID=A0A978UUG8_ZIZJJ|nr:hypothetical protein FEM48_Zijuj09G0180200 [Ziziphus jujuba var. spinosa]